MAIRDLKWVETDSIWQLGFFPIYHMEGAHGKTSPDLSLTQKWTIVCWSMQHYDFERFRVMDGRMILIMGRFKLPVTTIKRVLHEYWTKLEDGDIYPDLAPLSKKNVGVQLQLTDEMRENIVDLHFKTEGQSAIELFCEQYLVEFGMSISRSSMERYLSDLGADTKRIYLAPSLSLQQRIQRLDFVFGLILHDGHGLYSFIKECRIHADEKWFWCQELHQMVRYLPCEVRPRERTVRHKSHIDKTMFLAAIGTPGTYLVDGESFDFDGKIGIFPFIKFEPAKKNSKGRAKGSMVMTDISVDADVYYDIVSREGGLIHTLKRKYPFLKKVRVVIQHDGATPHKGKGNFKRLNDFGKLDGWHIEFDTQPPQSPDLNKCDLCFFHSLQRAANRIKASNTTREKLLEAVTKAYTDYDRDILERIEGIQHEIYRQILIDSGGNQFDMPHSDVRKRQREGADPCDRSVPSELYKSAQKSYLALKSKL
jgi:hypothetical protein